MTLNVQERLQVRYTHEKDRGTPRSALAGSDTASLLLRLRLLTNGDRVALEGEILRRHFGAIRGVAFRYRGRGIEMDDLEQVAGLGMIKAIRRFDPDLGFSFLAYARPTMSGEVRRHFRDCGWTIRPPRSVQEVQARVFKADAELTQLLGASPTASDLAAHLELDLGVVVEALSTDGCFAPSSLDAPSARDGFLLSDLLGAEGLGLARVEARATLAGAVRNLTTRDRRVVELRFFRGLTQARIGAEIGISQVQVSRVLMRILDDLRRELEPPDADHLGRSQAAGRVAEGRVG